MAKVICVLYDDPVEGYPRLTPVMVFLSWNAIRTGRRCRPEGDRFHARRASWQCFRGTRAA